MKRSVTWFLGAIASSEDGEDSSRGEEETTAAMGVETATGVAAVVTTKECKGDTAGQSSTRGRGEEVGVDREIFSWWIGEGESAGEQGGVPAAVVGEEAIVTGEEAAVKGEEAEVAGEEGC